MVVHGLNDQQYMNMRLKWFNVGYKKNFNVHFYNANINIHNRL